MGRTTATQLPLWPTPIPTSAAKRETLRLHLDTILERLGRPPQRKRRPRIPLVLIAEHRRVCAAKQCSYHERLRTPLGIESLIALERAEQSEG